MPSLLEFYLIFVAFVIQVYGESACVNLKASEKIRQLHSTRLNLLIVTNTSCSINYFDLSIVNRLTLSVIARREILLELDLSNNAISEIESGTFDDFMALENLNLRNNFLRTLGEQELQELSALTILDLSSNQLEFINLKAFAKLPNLLSLNIRDNCLINVFLVLPLNFLHSLNLSHNRINDFPQLIGISAITDLDVSYNNISDLTQIEIVRNIGPKIAKSISSLNMAGNQLRHPNQLLSFVNLVELNLANNPIAYGENENFIRQSAAALKKLNLTNTNLSSLNIFQYVNCEQLEELSIAHNPLLTDFNKLLKFSNLRHLQFQQKFCQEFDSYRTIRRNFKRLNSVSIFYDDTPNCACVRRNEKLFKFESIDFTTDWSVCSSAAAVREYFFVRWSIVGVTLVVFSLIYEKHIQYL